MQVVAVDMNALLENRAGAMSPTAPGDLFAQLLAGLSPAATSDGVAPLMVPVIGEGAGAPMQPTQVSAAPTMGEAEILPTAVPPLPDATSAIAVADLSAAAAIHETHTPNQVAGHTAGGRPAPVAATPTATTRFAVASDATQLNPAWTATVSPADAAGAKLIGDGNAPASPVALPEKPSQLGNVSSSTDNTVCDASATDHAPNTALTPPIAMPLPVMPPVTMAVIPNPPVSGPGTLDGETEPEMTQPAVAPPAENAALRRPVRETAPQASKSTPRTGDAQVPPKAGETATFTEHLDAVSATPSESMPIDESGADLRATTTLEHRATDRADVSARPEMAARAEPTARTESNARAEHAHEHQRAAREAHASPNQVAVHLARAAVAGVDRLTINLVPAELGRIEIQMTVAEDKSVHAVVRAENPVTLDLLQRDTRGLERALESAGLRADAGALDFGLRGEDRRNGAFNTRESTGQLGEPGAQPDSINVSTTRPQRAGLGVLDLTI